MKPEDLPPFQLRAKAARSLKSAHTLCIKFAAAGYSPFQIGKRDDGSYIVFPIHPEDDFDEALAYFENELAVEFSYSDGIPYHEDEEE